MIVNLILKILFSVKKRFYYLFFKQKYGFLGKNSLILKPLLIRNHKKMFIGKNVLIRQGLRMEAITKYRVQNFQPALHIGNGTSIEQFCHIICANKVFIGEDVTISSFVFISDVNHDYSNISKGILAQNLVVRETTIGDQSFIGSGAKILPGVAIGKHCIVGTNSVVNKDVPDYSVVVGAPAKIIKRYNFETGIWERVGAKING